MIRLLVMVVALSAAWGIQALTWLNAPSSPERQGLIELSKVHYKTGDEVAFLPAWERSWAVDLERLMPEAERRLGRQDLMRPSSRLWLFRSIDAPPWSAPEGVILLRSFENKGLRAQLLQRQAKSQPFAWPKVGSCSLSRKRKHCSSQGAKVQFSELAFDGSFARGFKITLGKQPLELRFKMPRGARLLGGIGLTAHGHRHARSAVRARLVGQDSVSRQLPIKSGMQSLQVMSDNQGEVLLTLQAKEPQGTEIALSVGWAL
jgi:hypothetical protein